MLFSEHFALFAGDLCSAQLKASKAKNSFHFMLLGMEKFFRTFSSSTDSCLFASGSVLLDVSGCFCSVTLLALTDLYLNGCCAVFWLNFSSILTTYL